MSVMTLAASAALAAVSMAVFLYLGVVMRRRPAVGADREALDAFAWWWFGLGAINAYTVVANAFAAAGRVNLVVLVTILHPLFLLLCASLWGLTYYLVYLFTGSRAWRLPTLALYATYYLAIEYLIEAANPNGLVIEAWGIRLLYEHAPASGMSLALGIVIVVPTLLGAIGYFTLYFRAKQRAQHYRIAMIASSVFVWFASGLAATFLGVSDATWWPMVNRGIALMAALMILAAFQPPKPVRHWLEAPMHRAALAA